MQNIIKQCKNLIKPINKKYIHQMNPQSPNMIAKIKIHKPKAPIRPIINNTNAPTHKLAKYIYQELKTMVNLKYEYNVSNTIQFIGFFSIDLIRALWPWGLLSL
jgi:hypothetical protein